ncbi:PilC/PilY family type IV pilus protein [Dyella sp. ASV21]|uniref:pilus assembly protein n=1 Tax=Dyella sp. ASV21 TaxID=2795114 RepID=UPI0018EC8BAA|nr:PilC/PilY family type IV pilus protein [Dyella sp. ASV21]
MNTHTRMREKMASFVGRLMCTSLLVCSIGIISAPVHAASTAVTIDTSPLIIQPSLPPNIMLMLDDSGSMAWDFMPDANYLMGATTYNNGDVLVDIDALRYAGNNGTYYDPSVTYTPPVKADGKSSYTTPAGMDTAFVDGFLSTATVDVTQYASDSFCDYNNVSARNCVSGSSTSYHYFKYYTPFAITTTQTSTYATNPTCSSGSTLVKDGSSNNGLCKSGSGSNISYKQPSNTGCGSDTYLPASLQCQKNTPVTNTYYLFTYTVPGTNGGYTRKYVGKTGDCANANLASSVCSESKAAQQNVANWFSYYRTRIMMAKSGLMTAFSTLDKTYRVGFGSINNNNSSDINATGLSNNKYNGKNLAAIRVFGDGTGTSQKAAMWTWTQNITPNGGTPLRVALDALGQYYQNETQPWQTDPSATSGAKGSDELACRASYAILTTDGFWNESDGSVTGIGDQDGQAGPTIAGPTSQDYTYVPLPPFADTSKVPTYSTPPYPPTGWTCPSGYSLTGTTCYKGTKTTPATAVCNKGDSYDTASLRCLGTLTASGTTYSNTLADVAMKYWLTDLRPASNEVPTNNFDRAFWQHMTTFTMGLGFVPQDANGNAMPMDKIAKWANGDQSQAIAGFSWPKPSASNGGSINNISDLAHAAINGHGGFYSATNPQTFSSGLKDALNRASERVGSGASLAANSTQLQNGTVAYQASYYTVKWTGDLVALPIDSSTGAIAARSAWNAAGKMPAAASRKIYSYNPSSSTYLAFSASGSTPPALSGKQLAVLGTDDTSRASMVNYLRGDSSNEVTNGGIYRNRSTVLGDIIDSQPVYVGAPLANQFLNQSFTGSSGYTQFASDKSKRTGVIYVAANDGMLHGFDASTGAELYAYLPGAVITDSSTNGIRDLANPDYGVALSAPHQYFNDGELTVADVYMGSAWKTVLVGTTGRGLAKSIYALDVTDPANVKFLWERSANDGNSDGNSQYIGQMTGKPVIAQTSISSWSVLMGNGYNSAGGVSALLQFELSTGLLSVHKTTDTTGLAAPAVWMDNATSGISNVAYAGDLSGNVWSFSLNSGGTAFTPTSNSAGKLLFTATDSGGTAQPITSGLLVGKNAQTGDVWVFFGTGKYLTSTDLSNTNPQTWYGLIVTKGATSSYKDIGSQTEQNRKSLVQRYITAETSGSSSSAPARTVTTTAQATTSMNGKSGWYMDLLQPSVDAKGTVTYIKQGERMVTPNQFQGNLLLGTTRIPTATDLCNPSGTGWVMALDPFTGTSPQSDFFDINGDGKVNSSDRVGSTPAAGMGFSSLPNNPIFVGSQMLINFQNNQNKNVATSGGGNKFSRVSWRELISP